ncbi:hypothetical protein ABZU76_49030 [Amycolatopsis sp. NPDC005232]|uniref:hypothetical protein n=1 Tax=Amycolatopsis sp. NPDC005232 TaxID=3157027 RepID=UPI0033B05226
MIEKDFEDDLRSLASATGVSQTSFESGHSRWDLYSRVISSGGALESLLALIRREPDESIATSVVLKCLEIAPEVSRGDFVDALPAGNNHELAKGRMRDLAILEKIVSGEDPSFNKDFEPKNWSHWLQLRAAKATASRRVLEFLSSSGSTRRIRHEARMSLNSLGCS